MKKIGHEVYFIGASENNPRNGEGDFIRLKDGRIMFAYTAYEGDNWGDHKPAHINAVFSSDEGDTFEGKRTIAKLKDGSLNYMCVSLLRMGNGDIGLFFLKKYINTDGNLCTKLMLMRSSDESESWSQPQEFIDEDGYFVIENARLVRLESGRIICPANLHKTNGETVTSRSVMCFFISDDDGKTFYDSGNRIESFAYNSKTGLQETGVAEMENGRLFAYSRTDNGAQFESFSDDGGLSWTVPVPSTVFYSREAPMIVRHICGDYTVAIYNPCAFCFGDESRTWGRTPIIATVCKGKGGNFWKNNSIKHFYIEKDEFEGYCYPTVFDGGDYFLCSYYYSNNSGGCLNSCKIIKVKISEVK